MQYFKRNEMKKKTKEKKRKEKFNLKKKYILKLKKYFSIIQEGQKEKSFRNLHKFWHFINANEPSTNKCIKNEQTNDEIETYFLTFHWLIEGINSIITGYLDRRNRLIGKRSVQLLVHLTN